MLRVDFVNFTWVLPLPAALCFIPFLEAHNRNNMDFIPWISIVAGKEASRQKTVTDRKKKRSRRKDEIGKDTISARNITNNGLESKVHKQPFSL